MGTAKHTSFHYGEVAPALRHLGSAVPYQEGLKKLRNGIVRRTGGVSNRPGFRFLADLGDTNIPSENIVPSSTLLSFKDTQNHDTFLWLTDAYNVDILSREGVKIRTHIIGDTIGGSRKLRNADVTTVNKDVYIHFGIGTPDGTPRRTTDEFIQFNTRGL